MAAGFVISPQDALCEVFEFGQDFHTDPSLIIHAFGDSNSICFWNRLLRDCRPWWQSIQRLRDRTTGLQTAVAVRFTAWSYNIHIRRLWDCRPLWQSVLLLDLLKGGKGLGIKTWSLIILTVQNASLILTMRYTRTLPGDMYFASTAVMITEIVKAISSVVIMFGEKQSVVELLKFLRSVTIDHPLDMAKMLVPACIYTIQNNLLYVAVSNLDAATYQVSYQLKILTTALFSVAMLRKSISKLQWLSLFMLFVGVSVVQLQPVDGPVGNSPDETLPTASPIAKRQNPLLGLTAVVASSICSGFAGVYFEKTLKGSHTPLWARNFQLAIFSIVIGTVGMYINDGDKIKEKGVLFGYHWLVWAIVAMQAFGGLLVGVVVKYADNILKGFAAAVSIVVSCVASVYLFEFKLSVPFVSGAGLVMFATYLYGVGTKFVSNKEAALVNGTKEHDKVD